MREGSQQWQLLAMGLTEVSLYEGIFHSLTTSNVPLCERKLIVLRVLCLHRLHWVEFSVVS